MKTRPSFLGRRLSLARTVLASEGVGAVRDRILDRLADTRRQAAFTTRPMTEPPPCQAPVLNVLPTPPARRLGGLQCQLLARMAEEAELRPFALLYPWRHGFRLELQDQRHKWAYDFPGSQRPWSSSLRNEDLERTLDRACDLVGAGTLHLEGQSELPLASLNRLAVPNLVLSLHDFALFCLRPQLLEHPDQRFCHYTQDPDRCHRCLLHSFQVEAGFQAARREQASRLLARAAAVVVPSRFLGDRYRELFPSLLPSRLYVIPPAPLPSPPVKRPHLARPPRPGRPLHVAFAGGAVAHKGGRLFADIVGHFHQSRPGRCRFTVYGGGDAELVGKLRRQGDVRVRGYYRAGRLPHLLARDGVDVALLLSVLPETFNLVLSECTAARVPVVAFDHGAVAERIRAYGGGVLVDPGAGETGICRQLEHILDAGPPPPPALEQRDDLATAHQVARRHLDLYRSLDLLATEGTG